MNEKKIYSLNNDTLFRICTFGDCTDKINHWAEHIKKCSGAVMWDCFHEGDIHFHCPLHREMELSLHGGGLRGPFDNKLICGICSQKPDYETPVSRRKLTIQAINTLKQMARSLVQSQSFKNAKLIRIDDYCTPEVSQKIPTKDDSQYWVSYDVKKTKTGKTILILYIGDRDKKSKAQFFIEPETGKLSHDHKDDVPLEIIARVEVEFKNGEIKLLDKEV